MPVHVKNLQDLVHQYENHTSHFRELNDRFENVSSELKESQKKEKRLEAKNRTFQGQVGKLERERQEQDVMITEFGGFFRVNKPIPVPFSVVQLKNSPSH